MKRLMSTDILLLQETTKYEITIDKAKELYLNNSNVRYDEELYGFIYEKLDIDEIFRLNNEILLNYIKKVNNILTLECSKENLYNIYEEYNKIKYLFTDSNDILDLLYNLNLSIINKYGHSTLCFINLYNKEEMGNVFYSYLPIINMKLEVKRLLNSKVSPIIKNALVKKERNSYFGLLANALYLNNKELIDKIFNIIIRPHFKDYYLNELNIPSCEKDVIQNNDLEKDYFYTTLCFFIKDYNLDYNL